MKLTKEQLLELEKRLVAAEQEEALQAGMRQIRPGPAMELIQFHALEYLRRLLDEVKDRHKLPVPKTAKTGVNRTPTWQLLRNLGIEPVNIPEHLIIEAINRGHGGIANVARENNLSPQTLADHVRAFRRNKTSL